MSRLGFRTEEIADGRIALNSDTATQVFSPYSGRVIRVIAGIGQHVKKGAPLFSIEASEFAQTQSDLLNANTQLKLAQDRRGAPPRRFRQQGRLTAGLATGAGRSGRRPDRAGFRAQSPENLW